MISVFQGRGASWGAFRITGDHVAAIQSRTALVLHKSNRSRIYWLLDLTRARCAFLNRRAVVRCAESRRKKAGNLTESRRDGDSVRKKVETRMHYVGERAISTIFEYLKKIPAMPKHPNNNTKMQGNSTATAASRRFHWMQKQMFLFNRT